MKHSYVWSIDNNTMDFEFSLKTYEKLNNATLFISQTLYQSSENLMSYKDRKLFDSPEYDMLCDLAKILEFNFYLIRPDDKEFGRYKDGRWTGKIGLVHQLKADFAIGVLSISPSRFKAVRPTAIIAVEKVVIVSTKPSKLPRWQVIFEAFPLVIWSLIFASASVIGIIIYVIIKYDQTDENIPLKETLILPFHTLCMESNILTLVP